MREATTSPKCSHCGYELTEMQIIDHFDDTGIVNDDHGEISELFCLECKKTFYVVCEHHVFFVQVDKDGEVI